MKEETPPTSFEVTPGAIRLKAGDQEAEPWIEILPLRASWDRSSDEFAWKEARDGDGLEAALPFGTLVLRFRPVPEDAALHAEAILRTARPVRLHSLEIRYRTAFGPVVCTWAPHLRPGKDLVIADQVFRSPAVFAQSETGGAALVPDLAVWPDYVKTHMDLTQPDAGGCAELAIGVGYWRPTGHVFFKRVPARRALPWHAEICFAHYLLRIEGETDDAYRRVGSFLWRRFAPTGSILPQVLPFKEYERHATARIFAPDLYREFEADGVPVAGMITQTVTARRKPGVMNERETDRFIARQRELIAGLRFLQRVMAPSALIHRLITEILHAGRLKIAPMISFESWNNQVRTALGAALCARRIGDQTTVDRAARIVELILSAPTDEGCWPAICLAPEGKVRWIRGTRAFELIDSYHLPNAAVTGFHLLEWHERIRPDDRILDRCRALARFLIDRQNGGAVPAWVRKEGDRWAADPVLARSASTAAPAMFWARLNRVAPDPAVADATRSALAFVEREVLPEEKWFDYELIYSCAGRPTGQDGPCPFTGLYPANTLCMYWAARAALDLYAADGDDKSLRLARRILDRLSMYQQVFDHPRLSIHTFGGFGVMNADGEFNDARQGLFVPLYLDAYRATGDAELFERGIATLRACFTTMLLEDQRAVAPGNLVRFRPSDRGSILENYAHMGRDEVTAGYLSPDWGCGTSLYASGAAFADFGQIYIDAARKHAFGLDGMTIRMEQVESDAVYVTAEGLPIEKPEAVLDDRTGRIARVVVNGREAEAIPDRPGRFRII